MVSFPAAFKGPFKKPFGIFWGPFEWSYLPLPISNTSLLERQRGKGNPTVIPKTSKVRVIVTFCKVWSWFLRNRLPLLKRIQSLSMMMHLPGHEIAPLLKMFKNFFSKFWIWRKMINDIGPVKFKFLAKKVAPFFRSSFNWKTFLLFNDPLML